MFDLSNALKSEFTTTTRQRGLNYFQRHLVDIKTGNQWKVTAKVRGSARYDVELKREKSGVIEASCSCPYVRSYDDPCKHIYAVILAADDKHYLQGDGNNSDVIIDLQRDDEYDDDYDNYNAYEEEDDDDGDYYMPKSYQAKQAKQRITEDAKRRINEAQQKRLGLITGRQLVPAEPPPPPEWKKTLSGISQAYQVNAHLVPFQWPTGRELLYVVDLPAMAGQDGVVIETHYREPLKTGGWSKWKPIGLRANQVAVLPDPVDQQILTWLVGGREFYGYTYFYGSSNHRYQISAPLAQQTLPIACQTGRCLLRRYVGQEDCEPLSWEAGGAYTFWLDVLREAESYHIIGSLRRDEDGARFNLTDVLLLTEQGLLFTKEYAARINNPAAAKWFATLRQTNGFRVPLEQGPEFLEAILQLPNTPRLSLPEDLRYEEVTFPPHPRMILKPHEQKMYNDRVKGYLHFAYGETILERNDPRTSLYQAEQRKLVRRDFASERLAYDYLLSIGFKDQRDYYNSTPYLMLKTSRVPKTIQTLLDNGWHVEAEGKLYRRPGNFSLSVASGIDWFELHGEVDFEGMTVHLPDLLAALKRGQTTVQLGDGTFGILPEEWMKKYGMIAATGDAQDDHVRFTRAQAGLLDALLAAQPDVEFDATFAKVREELKNFTGVAAKEPPEGFVGELRGYQKEALGWFEFLQKFGFGGCLADDMGLGKCLAPDTLVYLNGGLTKVEEIWQHFAGVAEFDGEGWWATPNQELLTNSLDEQQGIIRQTRVQRLYRQYVRERLRKVTLEDGNAVTITQAHRLLTNKGWTNELHAGDYVCVPAKLMWEGKPEDPDLIKLLAWQIGEGYEEINSAQISQKDTAVLEELRQCAERFSQRTGIKLNHPRIHTDPVRVPNLAINSAAWRRYLEARGYVWGKRSREKSFPPFLMQADLSSLRLLLRNYFDAEGSVSPQMRCVEISTASPLLIEQLATLLRRFGIWLRISAKRKCATNGARIYRTYYCGILGGNSARRFFEQIGFGCADKQQRLAAICAVSSNTNVEGIPASAQLAQTVQACGLPVRHFGLHNSIYLNGSQQFSRHSLSRVITGLDRILSGEAEQSYRERKSSKWTQRTLAAYAQLDTQQLIETRTSLQHLLEQEVFYCRIKCIEEIEYEGWVYDLEIKEHHNFVANHILCHNTVQVLALMERRRELRADQQSKSKPAPTLVVVPKSLVFNWQAEASRFTPHLKVLNHTGGEREKETIEHFDEYDVILTTYGTLRNDAVLFKDKRFDYVVLDEAQAIKNANTESSKAARLLQADHKLALSGTPIENHLGELWSLFDFLNPGLLGASSVFGLSGNAARNPEEETKKILSQALRPFILRRTKGQVAKDLPPKLEQTIYCEMEPAQTKLYNDMKQHYRQTLLGRIDQDGINKSKMHILEALLRLRQAACHPGLLDPKKAKGSSAKLDVLFSQLEELTAEGHKTLVFSQFTSLLAIVREQLDKTKIPYEYLDGKTRNRQEKVERFQTDDNCKLFLISLKAGGVGLNLTAADYVFLLDPWWNPAVEAQAIDRTHRIGQTKQVFAYRLITRGTVEEKVLQLQDTKRDLADAIISANNSMIRSLKREDLELLLS
jgi:intein/homing endonuclease